MTDSVFSEDELVESIDLEAKRAGGRDGRGHLPNDVWETYSSFANTKGGTILLGVSEDKNGKLVTTGIEDTATVLSQLWDGLNNSQKISVNLISENDITRFSTESGRFVLKIEIPRASRTQRPVFINGNPMTGSYRRENSGDYLYNKEEVKRMLAEQVEDARDARFLENYTLDDICTESLKAYRNRLASLKPDHPFNQSDDLEFLRQLGGWKRDRKTQQEGLTLAGLLMFGKHTSITEVVPHYFLDYRELPTSGTKTEWTDRLTPDGTWSGNLYDFYHLAMQKFSRDLKVPFKLEGSQRADDTPIHQSIREALVNALVHADYSQTTSILAIKAPDYFEFRNPGKMRIPVAQALEGGHSDCRKRSIQKMFSLIGLGEQAGSGVRRVVENWKSQHYRFPELWESDNPETTLMKLRTVSLLPSETLEHLSKQFGQKFTKLREEGRLALATAEIEGFISNERLQQLTRMHPRDITDLFKQLVKEEFLLPSGQGRATTYSLPGTELVDLASSPPGSEHLTPSSGHLGASLGHLDVSLGHLGASSGHLLEIAQAVRQSKKTAPTQMQEVIIQLCAKGFLTTPDLAKLLDRSADGLRKRFIKPMVDAGTLKRRFPNSPNHESQAYTSKLGEE